MTKKLRSPSELLGSCTVAQGTYLDGTPARGTSFSWQLAGTRIQVRPPNHPAHAVLHAPSVLHAVGQGMSRGLTNSWNREPAGLSRYTDPLRHLTTLMATSIGEYRGCRDDKGSRHGFMAGWCSCPPYHVHSQLDKNHCVEGGVKHEREAAWLQPGCGQQPRQGIACYVSCIKPAALYGTCSSNRKQTVPVYHTW